MPVAQVLKVFLPRRQMTAERRYSQTEYHRKSGYDQIVGDVSVSACLRCIFLNCHCESVSRNCQIYLYCSNGYGRSGLSNTAIEGKLSVGATTRNWKTVNALLAMTK